MIRAAEFFAGMGLMRAGLNQVGIDTIFANDINKTKACLYRDNWGADDLHVRDIKALAGSDIPTVDIATASFPCVDLSLAGNRKGLAGSQSGLIFEFLRLLGEMGTRAPRILLIENVLGFLTANDGLDWNNVISELRKLGYETDHIIVDASAFLPQSRARVFILANRGQAFRLPEAPTVRDDLRLSDVAEHEGEWWEPKRLGSFLLSLSSIQTERVSSYQKRKDACFFGAYRRTRNGIPVWEVRADERAGALRTTRGGSAKQAILRAGCGSIAVRWMDVSEYSRLQGAEDLSYSSVSRQQAMFALGDAVCVPVVKWLGENCLIPMANQ